MSSTLTPLEGAEAIYGKKVRMKLNINSLRSSTLALIPFFMRTVFIGFSVYYPIAYTNWQVNFYARPKNTINVKNGVTSDGPNNFTRSNAVPGGMDPTANVNSNMQWVYPN
jgi:hypothetical protein